MFWVGFGLEFLCSWLLGFFLLYCWGFFVVSFLIFVVVVLGGFDSLVLCFFGFFGFLLVCFLCFGVFVFVFFLVFLGGGLVGWLVG